MLLRSMAVLALVCLPACDEVDLEPRPPQGALLEAGAYDLVVRDVVSIACDADPGVMRGQAVPAELARTASGGAGEVTFSFAGWSLRGVMEPGLLHVEGVVAEPVPVEDGEVPDETDEDDSDGGDTGSEDTDTAPSEGEDVPVDEGDGREPAGGSRPPEGREPRASALLDARIVEAELAEGSLFLSLPDCEVELAVVIGRGGGRPPVVGSEEEPSEPPSEGEERPDEGGSGGTDEGREEG